MIKNLLNGHGTKPIFFKRLFTQRSLVILIFLSVGTLIILPWSIWKPSITVFKMESEKETRVDVKSMLTENPAENLSFVYQKYEKPTVTKSDRGKPWFMAGGTEYPSNFKGLPRLLADQADGDRIVDQLMYVPENYQGHNSSEKVILAYNSLHSWKQNSGSSAFRGCPVSRCTLTNDRQLATTADAIIYKNYVTNPGVARPKNQVWIMYLLESPYHTSRFQYGNIINWTANYRGDSDIVTPYERWTYYDPQVRQKDQHVDYAATKTKKVAWFVSNCASPNDRFSYAKELAKYIDVDIYGRCGKLTCPRTSSKCFDMLRKEYKFYLSFENSNCRDYITEKFYVNALNHSVIPIVMGARQEDYRRSAPEGSYIHVEEFASPAKLAAYLHLLDNDNALYNAYFRWRGTGEFINTYFWCRLCAVLHAPIRTRRYADFNNWWRGPGICTEKTW